MRSGLKAEMTRTTPEIGLIVAGHIMQHVDIVSMAVAQSYLEEATGLIQDRDMLQRDLLEALISGGEITERIEGHLQRFGLYEESRNVVIVMRHRNLAQASPKSLRDPVAEARKILPLPEGKRSLIGIRDEEVVIVYPLGSVPNDDLREKANKLAVAMPKFVVGLSRPHRTLSGIADGYLEAQYAIMATPVTIGRARAFVFTDALLHHILRKSEFRNVLNEETILPLVRYDTDHDAHLLSTLRTYIEVGFSLTKVAAVLKIQPNTVRYRLKRIMEVTGYSPFASDDLILLALGVRLPEIRPQGH